MSRAAAHYPWPDLPDLSNDDLDNPPMSWDAIATYALITLNAMISLVVVLVGMGYALGVL